MIKVNNYYFILLCYNLQVFIFAKRRGFMSDIDVEEVKSVAVVEQEVPTATKSEHEKAINIVDNTKKIIADAQEQVNECMLLLKDDLEKFETSKKELKEQALDESEKLLLELGFESDMLEDKEEAKIDFEEVEAKAQEGRVEVRDISSGKFSSLIIAVIFGLIVAAALLYWAASSTSTAFDLNSLANTAYLNPLLVWLGEKFVGSATEGMGIATLAVVTLLATYLVYMIRVSLRATKNLRQAQQTHEKAQFYCTQKDECKAQMEKVDAHLNETVDIINFYKILLQEQNMRLKRVLFVEEAQKFHLYHYKSQADMENTQRLVNSVDDLLATPIASGGQLSDKAQEALMLAKENINKHIKAIYDKNANDIF